MANLGEVVGNIHPTEVIQQDTKACLPATLLGIVDPTLDLSEADIIDVMTEDGLYVPESGTGLYPANVLNHTVQKLGLAAHPVFDARVVSQDEQPKIEDRLMKVAAAFRNHEDSQVVIAYPKRREGQAPFLHYASVTGYEEAEDGPFVTISDSSDYVYPDGSADGGIKRIHWTEFVDYLTPGQGIPVMAWAVNRASEFAPELSESFEEAELPGFGLLGSPLSKDEDTGTAVPPDTLHPSSVVMPTAEITQQFNDIGSIVLSRDGQEPIGYPRFVVPKTVRRLAFDATGDIGSLPYPTREAAEAAGHLARTYGNPDMADITEADGLFWLRDSGMNNDAWQHTGLGISSRQALATLEGRGSNDLEVRAEAEHTIKTLLAKELGARHDDIYLFPTGMAAIYTLNQALIAARGDAPGVQFGFPYTDTFEQRKFGPGFDITKNVIDFREGDYDALRELVMSGQPIRSVTTEYPSNPKLWTPNFELLDEILDGKAPVIIDPTIASAINIDPSKLPPSVVALAISLTKFFSSVGNVMGGSVVLQPGSNDYAEVKAAMDAVYRDELWHEDAVVLAKNSAYFPEVMPVINKSGESTAKWLVDRFTGSNKPLAAVYHPAVHEQEAYDAIRKESGGYGGLMSLKFNDPDRAYRFFDRLDITKGPSLGTYYTLGCLYTWLAHHPVDSVRRFGVDPDLVRISIGIEDADDLKGRFEEAIAYSA